MERFSKCCIHERIGYDGSSCMILDAISMEARTYPAFIAGVGHGPNRRVWQPHSTLKRCLLWRQFYFYAKQCEATHGDNRSGVLYWNQYSSYAVATMQPRLKSHRTFVGQRVRAALSIMELIVASEESTHTRSIIKFGWVYV